MAFVWFRRETIAVLAFVLFGPLFTGKVLSLGLFRSDVPRVVMGRRRCQF